MFISHVSQSCFSVVFLSRVPQSCSSVVFLSRDSQSCFSVVFLSRVSQSFLPVVWVIWKNSPFITTGPTYKITLFQNPIWNGRGLFCECAARTSQSKFSFALERQKESSSAILFSRCGPLNARPNRVSQNFIVHFNFHWIISYNNNKSCSYRIYRRLHLAKSSWQNLIWTEEVLLCQPTPIFMTYRSHLGCHFSQVWCSESTGSKSQLVYQNLLKSFVWSLSKDPFVC